MDVPKASVAERIHGPGPVLCKALGALPVVTVTWDRHPTLTSCWVSWRQVDDDDGETHLSVTYKFGACVVVVLLCTHEYAKAHILVRFRSHQEAVGELEAAFVVLCERRRGVCNYPTLPGAVAM